ncbi:hypothetical protein K443DRAFT_281699 [Laccaria amethystina LaAM-08-1]|uniref:Uncharacterized protein n=1 Tax=Laccaria amethystina LaAM-08-1 TaxID=1095629 RepID=A0A0C9X5M0_9AGAR|nr:hypothetical protein K443DRAFT_281699 [Laccaria amethystina LaAM-08-1]
MSEQLPMPFKTSTIAVSNMTGSRLRLALCSIDPTNDFDLFSPVVDLDSVASFGKHVFACKPPVMLQAYAVSGYQGHQLIDPSQLRCPLFLNASSSGPHAIDLRKLNNQLTKYQLYSDDTGKVILEMINDYGI